MQLRYKVWDFHAGTVFLCACAVLGGWMGDACAAPQAPESVHAYSGPQKAYLEWPANADYDLRGYDIWRTQVDESGQAVAAPERIQAGWRANEFATPLPAWPHYYRVRSVDLSGAKSAPSPPSEIVEPGRVTLFIPDIRFNTDRKSDLYVRIRDENPESVHAILRVPFAVNCAYGMGTGGASASGMGIAMVYPEGLLSGTDGLALTASGITAGLPLAYNLLNTGEVRLASADATAGGRSLYGAGILFNAYLPIPVFTEDSGQWVCRFLSESEDTTGNGTRFYDVDLNPINLALRNGTCQALTGALLRGDADGDGTIDAKDPLRILEALNGEGEPVEDIHDINLDSLVDAADASMIQRWIDRLDIELPAPTKADPEVSKAYVDVAEEFHPVLAIGPLKGNPGDTVEVLLTLDSGAEPLPLAGFSIVMTYPAGDDAVVEAIADPGDALPSDAVFSQSAEVNGGHGALHLSASMKEGVGGTGVQTLAAISFTIGSAAAPGTSYPVLCHSFVANDQYGHTPRHGAPGQAKAGILTGAVIASLLSAKDNSPIDTASVRLETLGRVGEPSEDNQGVYAFAGVPDGAYTLFATAQGFANAQTFVTVANAEVVSATISMQIESTPKGEGEQEGEGEEEGEGEVEGEKPCKGILRCGPVERPTGGVWGDGLALILVLAVLSAKWRRGREVFRR